MQKELNDNFNRKQYKRKKKFKGLNQGEKPLLK